MVSDELSSFNGHHAFQLGLDLDVALSMLLHDFLEVSLVVLEHDLLGEGLI